jgi:predicted nucleotidyltransferase component of viral defense system
MKAEGLRNMAASVRDRLLAIARQTGRNYESSYKERLILKGGLLLMGLGIPQARVTRDVDFLGLFPGTLAQVSGIIQSIGRIDDNDGLTYDFSQMNMEQVTEDADYPGVRVKFSATLGQARIPMQIDIGFGDVVVPAAKELIFPTLLDMEPPVLMTYSVETIVAEKIEAALNLAMLNSRMKDLYDIWMLSMTHAFEGDPLQDAVMKTCRRRGTALTGLAVVFSDEYAVNERMRLQWAGLVRRGLGTDAPEDFAAVMTGIRIFLLPVAMAAEKGLPFTGLWSPGGPWIKHVLEPAQQQTLPREPQDR